MSRWSIAVLSWAKTNVQKSALLHYFGLLDLCHALGLWPQPVMFPATPPHPSPASALLDNTPSIWRWGTTHVHSKTTSIRGRIVLSLLWVQNTFVCLFFLFFCCFFLSVNICSLFYARVFVLLLYITSIKAGLRGQRERLLRVVQSVTFQLQG